MTEKIKTPLPSLKGLWSLLWRATLLFPFAAILMTLYLAAWMAIFALPFFEIYFVWYSEWLFALITPAAWFLSFLLVRWKRFKIDSKDILNDQENI
jgi:hypothetical protein